mgnify:CR=1 FL=1
MSDNINSIGIEDYENKYGILGNTEKKSLDNFMNVEDAFRYETNSDKIKNILEMCRNYNVCQGFTPISQALPFAKPYDFEANRVNLPTPQKMGNINNNNYKPNPATITILEDENRERNSWGFNSMIAGASLIGAGALAYNTYRNMRNKKEAGGDMITKSQIIHPPADRGLVSNPIEDTLMGLQSSILSNKKKELEEIARGQALQNLRVPPDSPPDRGLVSNPLEARTEARGIINEVLARTFTTLDNKNRKQPRKNEFAGVPEFGGNIPPSKDLIRNRKYFDNL